MSAEQKMMEIVVEWIERVEQVATSVSDTATAMNEKIDAIAKRQAEHRRRSAIARYCTAGYVTAVTLFDLVALIRML